jgi:hypothetical protein
MLQNLWLLPLFLFNALGAAWLISRSPTGIREFVTAPGIDAGVCAKCRYSIQGNASSFCPECGTLLSASTIAYPRHPRRFTIPAIAALWLLVTAIPSAALLYAVDSHAPRYGPAHVTFQTRGNEPFKFAIATRDVSGGHDNPSAATLNNPPPGSKTFWPDITFHLFGPGYRPSKIKLLRSKYVGIFLEPERTPEDWHDGYLLLDVATFTYTCKYKKKDNKTDPIQPIIRPTLDEAALNDWLSDGQDYSQNQDQDPARVYYAQQAKDLFQAIQSIAHGSNRVQLPNWTNWGIDMYGYSSETTHPSYTWMSLATLAWLTLSFGGAALIVLHLRRKRHGGNIPPDSNP